MIKQMTSQECREKINSTMRYIAYKVYPKAGERTKFAKAYDKLSAKVLIDHDIAISDLTDSATSKANNIFDVLGERDLQLVLESAESLRIMYNKVFEEMYA